MDIQNIANDLWEIRSELRLPGGIYFPTCTTIARLKSGDLWVHSPGPTELETIEKIRALGDVRYIVAPNRFHHLYVGEFASHFPDAEIWGAPGLAEKRKDLTFTSTLGDEHPWKAEIDAQFIKGAPSLNETTFFHQSSNTLICTDLLFNFVSFRNLMTKLILLPTGATNGLVQSRSWWAFAKNRQEVGASTGAMLNWDFSRIVMAHGDAVEGDDLRARFADLVRWIPEPKAKLLAELG